ncbi:SH3 domain-containing protein [Bacillus cereus group sp. TH152-1LC]|uniref:SH3 domain-containing protein n=1 Tax=Bacillus cereus group sp. TH152-1LC TaxID=3018060 RepID=UPI0022E691E7|nr:SH3 domain-containing protein [Bacillus cereus group sp. TH152-1LC]MDA1674530.1 SH3 domain-containing protein [Bacillus cereus group sp. TH152-1LC]
MLNGISRKVVSALLIAVIFMSSFSLNLINVQAASQGTVTASALNVREKPSISSKIIGKLNNKATVTVNKTVGEWMEINYNSRNGYVSSQYITLSNKPTGSVQKIMTPTVSTLNVRAGAGTDFKILTTLSYGEKVTVVSQSGNWGYFIRNNKNHYVYLPYMKETSSATISETGKVGYVTADSLNVRQAANTTSSVIGALTQGKAVTILSVTNNMGKINYNNGIGYVSMNYISYNQPSTPKPPVETGKVGYVTADKLNVRQAANTTSSVIGSLVQGKTVTILSVTNNMGKINYNNGIGYVSMSYISYNQPSTPQPPVETGKVGYVTADSLNVRQAANTTSSVIGAVTQGKAVTILSVTNNMGKINYNNGIGYVSMNYISYDKPSTSQPQTQYKYVVTADSLNVRNQPSTAGTIVGKVSNGQEVQYVKTVDNGWMQIKYNNKDAYVSSAYVEKVSANSNTGNSGNNGSSVNYASLKGKTIVLDAGHGGKDSGAVGNRLYEKDITLDMVKRVKSKLENNGANVILTRGDDTFITLSGRTSISNNSNAQIFVSIHINSADSTSGRGVETYYHNHSDSGLRNKSNALATSILNELLTASSMPNRGVHDANFQVIKYNHKPSTLLELGFISNPSDASIMADSNYRNKAAEAITRGISKYFN